MKTKNLTLCAIKRIAVKVGKLLAKFVLCGLSLGILTLLFGVICGMCLRETIFLAILATLFGVCASLLSDMNE